MKCDRWQIPLALLAALLCVGVTGRYLAGHPQCVTAHNLNLAGLVTNMGGVVIALFFGFPQPDFSKDVGIVGMPATPPGDGRTREQYNEGQDRTARLYRCMSMLALGLMFAGFAAQAVALFY